MSNFMNRRELLRLAGATALVVPAERFVRRFFPVGIDLRGPLHEDMPLGFADMLSYESAHNNRRVPPGYIFAYNRGAFERLKVRGT